jgi:hypothetical protein
VTVVRTKLSQAVGAITVRRYTIRTAPLAVCTNTVWLNITLGYFTDVAKPWSFTYVEELGMLHRSCLLRLLALPRFFHSSFPTVL